PAAGAVAIRRRPSPRSGRDGFGSAGNLSEEKARHRHAIHGGGRRPDPGEVSRPNCSKSRVERLVPQCAPAKAIIRSFPTFTGSATTPRRQFPAFLPPAE